MADLIDRISGESEFLVPPRPNINVHAWIGALHAYVGGALTRLQIADAFGITGNADEARQAGQIADKLDAKPAGLPIVMSTGNVTWSNMPAALTELFGTAHRRTIFRFDFCDRVRLVARVSTPGAASAIIWAQYSTDETVWVDLTNTLAIGGAPAGTRVSTLAVIPAGAKNGDVFLRIVGQNGDGAADPILGNICLQVTVPWDKDEYLSLVEGVSMLLEYDQDTLFHTDGVVNKAAVLAALGIAG